MIEAAPMRMLVFACSIVLCLASPADLLAQQQRSAIGWSGNVNQKVTRSNPLPVEPIPAPKQAAQPSVRGADNLVEPSEAQILHRIGRIYGYQSELLMAEADGDEEKARNLLELAMTEMSTLIQMDGVEDRPRFQEMFRTVLMEYERHYGSSDSLAFPYGDIFQVRADIFAAMNEFETPLLEDVQMDYLQPIETTIPMTMNRLVEQSIAYLLRSPEKHMYNWLSRAETYFPMVEQILREEGLPDELKYLAMVESGLVPTARSWAHAGGMWQFIQATGRAYDLDVNSWVDERLDPEKSTRAAARHLRDLYKMFDGDWHLALSGYNCSPGRIKRELARAEKRLGRKATFWDIYNNIPRETRNYVPMFIATSLVASNPDAFNLRDVKPGPKYEYDLVPVPGMLELSTIAQMSGANVETIRALNPELRRSSTPPTRSNYFIRIPLGSSDRFMAALEDLPPTQVKTAVEYTVRRGDALGRIASKHGVSLKELMNANNLRNTTIHPGQTLVIPVPAYDAPIEINVTSAKPSRVQYGNRAIRPIVVEDTATRLARNEAPAAPTRSTQSASTPVRQVSSEDRQEPKAAETQTRVVYTVRRGDSLTKIGEKYGVSVAQLRAWNNLRSSTIQVGQRLYLYENGSRQVADNKPAEHRVRRGDTLGKIASTYGVSVSQLKSWNNLKSSTIVPGQRLALNGSDGNSAVTHRVVRGDSLGKIARRYGVSVRQIKDWNGLRTNTIYPGQRLTINT